MDEKIKKIIEKQKKVLRDTQKLLKLDKKQDAHLRKLEKKGQKK